MSDITVTPELLDTIEAQAKAGYSTYPALDLIARIREIEADNAKLRHDIAAYVQANADLLDECDAARGRALDEATAKVWSPFERDRVLIANIKDAIRALIKER